MRPRVAIHWIRRDLRLEDDHGLYRALVDHGQVLPLFIFDRHILDRFENNRDRRVSFIHDRLRILKAQVEERHGTIAIEHGRPEEIWPSLLERFDVIAVTANHDHEPYALQRDERIAALLRSRGIPFRTFKDTTVFERNEVVKDDGSPYTVFTPYGRKWLSRFEASMADAFPSEKHLDQLARVRPLPMPALADLGFEKVPHGVPELRVSEELLSAYARTRDLPGIPGTSAASVHLRFGTISVRSLVRRALPCSPSYANELIWREFFMQILWHFPRSEHAFKPAYDRIEWRNEPADFNAWCEGRTGYPLVDAGMRELLATGLMHNRVRMVVASFLVKHLLIDWRWGEAWFAQKLLDFELSSNNGNWQWAAGCGCDAAPYFRVFNPAKQQEKFDPVLTYVKRWVPELTSVNYPRPIVVHEQARDRAIATYKAALREGPALNKTPDELFH